MTIAEIQAVMRAAGWPEEAIVKGSAVAYYESNHGDPHAGKVDGIESSYGLFQINLGRPGTALQRERASWGPPARLYDPLYNAQLALQLYRQGGWQPWTTTAILQPQRYQQYLPAAQAAYGGTAGEAINNEEPGDFFGLPDWLGTIGNDGTSDDGRPATYYSQMYGGINVLDNSQPQGSTGLVVGLSLAALILILYLN